MHDELRARFDNWLRGNPNYRQSNVSGWHGAALPWRSKANCAARDLGSSSGRKRKPRGSANHQCAPIGAAKGIEQ